MTERKYSQGLDLARVLAIYLVIVLHALTQYGGMQDNYAGKFLLAVSICCVDLFGLISGWLGVQSTTFKPLKIVKLWCQVVFTGVVVTVAWSFAHSVTLKDVGKALIPITAHEYWYFTAYVPLFFLMPILNAGMRMISRKMTGAICGVLFLLVVVLPYFNPYGSDTYKLGGGYSPMWLALLYVFGASLRILTVEGSAHRRLFMCGSFVLAMVSVCSSMFVKIGYCAPTVLMTAIGILLTCAHIERVGLRLRFLSSCAFGVYLWHVHPLVHNRMLGVFDFVSQLSVWLFVTIILLGAACIYLVASGLEFVRMTFFDFARRGAKNLNLFTDY